MANMYSPAIRPGCPLTGKQIQYLMQDVLQKGALRHYQGAETRIASTESAGENRAYVPLCAKYEITKRT